MKVTKKDLISQLNEADKRVIKAIKLYPEGKKVLGSWSKKEVVSHLAGWYEEGVDSLPKVLKGEKPVSFRQSIDGFNKRSVQKRIGMTIEEILNEMKDLHKEFIKMIKKLTDKQITDFFGTTLGKKPINVLWIINEAISHNNGHAKEIEKKYDKQ